MLESIWSGGQTGVDQAAWRAAKAVGLVTAGWMPRGYLTEEGPRPEFAELYNAGELSDARYSRRTKANVGSTGATLIVTPSGYAAGIGTALTANECGQRGTPCLIAALKTDWIEDAVAWLIVGNWAHVNVAGPRESSSPGIGEAAEKWLVEVFREVMERQRGGKT